MAVALYESANGYQTIMERNRIEASFDAKDYAIRTVAVIGGYTHEPSDGSPMQLSDAQRTLG